MSAAHTPGPWTVLDGTRVGVTLPSRVEGCGFASHCIALTHSDRPEIDAEANARLIAAAPDLLAALQNMLTGDYHDCPAVRDRRAAARAAIAKATGGAA